MTHTASHRRPAVTLVELLVVITLMIVLAGLAVAVSQSGVFGSQKVVSAGDRASGWLMNARQRAIRDGLPRGVRFLLNPVRDPALNPTADPTYFAATDAQYIESPEPWVPNPDPANNPKGPQIAFVYWKDSSGQVPNTSAFRQVYFTSIDPDPLKSASYLTEFDQRVVVGDYVLFPDLPSKICRIIAINNTTANVRIGGTAPGGTVRPGRLLVLADSTYPDLGANNSGAQNPSDPTACRTIYNFAFQPAPRPLIGEPTVQLTGGTAIDCRMTTTPTVALAPMTATTAPTTIGVNPIADGAGGYYFDVLFAANGGVMYNSGGIVCLWVRDPEKTPHPRVGSAGVDDRAAYDAAGEQVLVTLYPHTGVIATHPPAWLAPAPNNDPYRYAKDGINSGL